MVYERLIRPSQSCSESSWQTKLQKSMAPHLHFIGLNVSYVHVDHITDRLYRYNNSGSE